MKNADDVIYKVLDLCRYIKWTNVDSEQELYQGPKEGDDLG